MENNSKSYSLWPYSEKHYLVALTSQQRVQTIVSVSRHKYIQDSEWCQFSVIFHLQQSKLGRVVKPVAFLNTMIQFCV